MPKYGGYSKYIKHRAFLTIDAYYGISCGTIINHIQLCNLIYTNV